MKNGSTFWKTAAAFFVSLSLLCGCGVKEALTSGKKGDKEYQRAETMVIVTTERLRYEEVYSENIWTAAVDNRGTTFETVLLSQIHDFLKEVKLMSSMAKKEDLTLSGREKELARLAASEYMKELGEENAEEFMISEKDMENFYSDYWLSEKLVEKLVGGENLEVSDSEAKVITVSQIELSDPGKAEEILARVRENEADFASIAKEVSENKEIRKQISYGEMGKEYESSVFSLEKEEISGVLCDSGKYYIVKCMNDYDEAATKINKEKLVREKKNAAFYRAYQPYKTENPLTGEDPVWAELSIRETPQVTADFFDIFDRICRNGVS